MNIECFYQLVLGNGNISTPTLAVYSDAVGCIVTGFQDSVFSDLNQTNIFEASAERQHNRTF